MFYSLSISNNKVCREAVREKMFQTGLVSSLYALCFSLFHCLSPRNVSWWEFWKHGARNASPQCQTAQSASSLAAPKATDSLIIGFSVESKHRLQRLKRFFVVNEQVSPQLGA